MCYPYKGKDGKYHYKLTNPNLEAKKRFVEDWVKNAENWKKKVI